MTATDIKTSFRELDLNECIRLLGDLWDEMSADPTLFDLADDERRECERRHDEHRASPENSRSWAELRADLQEIVPSPAVVAVGNTPKVTS